MEIKINFQNRSKIPFSYLNLFKKIFAFIMNFENYNGEISLDLVLVSPQKAQKLALKYKKKEYVPDVLSFPHDFIVNDNGKNLCFLGEIFMTPTKIHEQAHEYGHSLKREFCYLFTHSLYHLLGFDHEDNQKNQEMHEKVEKILIQLEIFR